MITFIFSENIQTEIQLMKTVGIKCQSNKDKTVKKLNNHFVSKQLREWLQLFDVNRIELAVTPHVDSDVKVGYLLLHVIHLFL